MSDSDDITLSQDTRWEELKPVLQKLLDASIEQVKQPCFTCGKTVLMRSGQKFCSSACKTRYHNAKRRAELELLRKKLARLEKEVI